MGSEVAAVGPPMAEVPMVEAEAVREMREFAAKGWGARRIARELGLARNTVRLEAARRALALRELGLWVQRTYVTQAGLVLGVILELLSIGLAVGLWRGQERLASKVFWTTIVLVPFFGVVAFSVWHDPPGPSDPIDRPAAREWDLPPPPPT